MEFNRGINNSADRILIEETAENTNKIQVPGFVSEAIITVPTSKSEGSLSFIPEFAAKDSCDSYASNSVVTPPISGTPSLPNIYTLPVKNNIPLEEFNVEQSFSEKIFNIGKNVAASVKSIFSYKETDNSNKFTTPDFSLSEKIDGIALPEVNEASVNNQISFRTKTQTDNESSVNKDFSVDNKLLNVSYKETNGNIQNMVFSKDNDDIIIADSITDELNNKVINDETSGESLTCENPVPPPADFSKNNQLAAENNSFAESDLTKSDVLYKENTKCDSPQVIFEEIIPVDKTVSEVDATKTSKKKEKIKKQEVFFSDAISNIFPVVVESETNEVPVIISNDTADQISPDYKTILKKMTLFCGDDYSSEENTDLQEAPRYEEVVDSQDNTVEKKQKRTKEKLFFENHPDEQKVQSVTADKNYFSNALNINEVPVSHKTTEISTQRISSSSSAEKNITAPESAEARFAKQPESDMFTSEYLNKERTKHNESDETNGAESYLTFQQAKIRYENAMNKVSEIENTICSAIDKYKTTEFDNKYDFAKLKDDYIRAKIYKAQAEIEFVSLKAVFYTKDSTEYFNCKAEIISAEEELKSFKKLLKEYDAKDNIGSFLYLRSNVR